MKLERCSLGQVRHNKQERLPEGDPGADIKKVDELNRWESGFPPGVWATVWDVWETASEKR